MQCKNNKNKKQSENVIRQKKNSVHNFFGGNSNSPSVNKIYATLFSGLLFGASTTSVVALELDTGEWSSSINANITVGTSIRAQDPDNELYSAADGARAGLGNSGVGATNTDSANVNYSKGDAWSTLLRATIDYSISRDEFGLFTRVRAWHDFALKGSGVNQGNGANDYSQNSSLSDAGFAHLSKFSGVALLDAYVYNTFDVNDLPLQVRVGNQVINWGESLFVQGINQINPIDLTSLRRPGTEIRDAFLPVRALSANLGLGGGSSLEAFYQFQWSPANLDSCGTYWSPVEFQITTKPGMACSQYITTLPVPGVSNPAGVAAGLTVPMGQGIDGEDSNQYGIAFRTPVEQLDGELGFYMMKYSSRIPYISGRSGTNLRALNNPTLNPDNLLNPITSQVVGAAALGLPPLTPGTGLWEYPSGVKLYGLSYTTNISGWSLGAEASYIPNLPVQINANDLLAGLLQGVGPMGAAATAASAAVGTKVEGYDRLKKFQLQLNGIKILPRILGSAQTVFIGEVGYQNVNVGDSFTGNRYGRHFVFGTGTHLLYGGTPGDNTHPDGVRNDGYVTENSWGYRLRIRGEYPSIFGSSFTMFPTLSLRHDVKGYSADFQFLEDRLALGLSARFNLNKVHNIDLGYVYYADTADYDAFRDRDYYTVVLSTSF